MVGDCANTWMQVSEIRRKWTAQRSSPTTALGQKADISIWS
jgi:hypothetical protein